MQSTRIRPFLKWAGNKYRLLNHILPHMPKGNRFIEPFAGSAALFLNTGYHENLLAERNPDLISLYHHLKTEGEGFIQACGSYFTGEHNNKDTFYQLRQQFNGTDNARLRAILFLYLNRHGYNGLCRYNASGGFNVPFGRYMKPYFPYQELKAFHTRSQNTVFMRADFRQTFALANKGDVIYCDPPYVPLSATSSFSEYTQEKFRYEEQLALAQCARQAARIGCCVLISNHDTPLTREIYADAEIYSFPVHRYISARADRRISVMELLAVFK